MFKIASWNVNSINVRLPHVLQWLDSNKPDVLALQETKVPDEKFPAQAIQEIGYHVVYAGQKAYNGMALLSRKPAQDMLTDIPQIKDHQRRILAVTINKLRLINLYVPNGESLDSEKFAYKLTWFKAITRYISQQLKQFENVIVMGDFNVAPEARDTHDPEKWQNRVLVSDDERAALKKILDCGLVDSFRLFSQPEQSFSWWDYRAGSFRRGHGLRIDLMLISKKLAEKCQRAGIDKAPRAWERPSDHAPIFATFEL